MANSAEVHLSDELPNEEGVRTFLNSIDIPAARIETGISVLRQAVYSAKISILLADRAGADELPDTICEGADLVERAYVRETKKRAELFKNHAGKLHKLSKELWSLGIEKPRDLKRAPFSIGEDERYFHAKVQDLLGIYQNLEKDLLNRVSEHESAVERNINNPKSAEKLARNEFIKQCCIAWAVPMRQKLSSTTRTDLIGDEAHGPLTNFILEACKGVVSHHHLDRKKLRNFLKSSRRKIEEAIEVKLDQLNLRAERYFLYHDVPRSTSSEFDF